MSTETSKTVLFHDLKLSLPIQIQPSKTAKRIARAKVSKAIRNQKEIVKEGGLMSKRKPS